MGKTANIVLISVLIVISAYCIIQENWLILVANICLISAALIDVRIGKLLMRENVNYKSLKQLQKILIPVLYAIGSIAIIIFGMLKYFG